MEKEQKDQELDQEKENMEEQKKEVDRRSRRERSLRRRSSRDSSTTMVERERRREREKSTKNETMSAVTWWWGRQLRQMDSLIATLPRDVRDSRRRSAPVVTAALPRLMTLMPPSREGLKRRSRLFVAPRGSPRLFSGCLALLNWGF